MANCVGKSSRAPASLRAEGGARRRGGRGASWGRRVDTRAKPAKNTRNELVRAPARTRFEARTVLGEESGAGRRGAGLRGLAGSVRDAVFERAQNRAGALDEGAEARLRGGYIELDTHLLVLSLCRLVWAARSCTTVWYSSSTSCARVCASRRCVRGVRRGHGRPTRGAFRCADAGRRR